MEVVGHDILISSSSQYGGGVDLEELGGVHLPVVLLRNVWTELGRPCHRLEVWAQRSATGMYRTTPLRGVATHAPFFHDGSAATLLDVVEHYDTTLELGLMADEMADLVEYLKSL